MFALPPGWVPDLRNPISIEPAVADRHRRLYLLPPTAVKPGGEPRSTEGTLPVKNPYKCQVLDLH